MILTYNLQLKLFYFYCKQTLNENKKYLLTVDGCFLYVALQKYPRENAAAPAKPIYSTCQKTDMELSEKWRIGIVPSPTSFPYDFFFIPHNWTLFRRFLRPSILGL